MRPLAPRFSPRQHWRPALPGPKPGAAEAPAPGTTPPGASGSWKRLVAKRSPDLADPVGPARGAAAPSGRAGEPTPSDRPRRVDATAAPEARWTTPQAAEPPGARRFTWKPDPPPGGAAEPPRGAAVPRAPPSGRDVDGSGRYVDCSRRGGPPGKAGPARRADSEPLLIENAEDAVWQQLGCFLTSFPALRQQLSDAPMLLDVEPGPDALISVPAAALGPRGMVIGRDVLGRCFFAFLVRGADGQPATVVVVQRLHACSLMDNMACTMHGPSADEMRRGFGGSGEVLSADGRMRSGFRLMAIGSGAAIAADGINGGEYSLDSFARDVQEHLAGVDRKDAVATGAFVDTMNRYTAAYVHMHAP